MGWAGSRQVQERFATVAKCAGGRGSGKGLECCQQDPWHSTGVFNEERNGVKSIVSV